jgi:hypothetical protein
LGQISIDPGHTDPHPGEKKRKKKLNNKQAAEKKEGHGGKRVGCPELWQVREEYSLSEW